MIQFSIEAELADAYTVNVAWTAEVGGSIPGSGA